MGLETMTMPRGVYPRTPRQLEVAKTNLLMGRSRTARARARATLRLNAANPKWRAMVSDLTRKAMRRPGVRRRHLAGLARARKSHGPNWKGGNGRPPLAIIKALTMLLRPAGFLPELIIKTKPHRTAHSVPTHYRADFGHPKMRVVLEIDGPSHRNLPQKRRDAVKTAVLTSLGWLVLRAVVAGESSWVTNPDSAKPSKR